MKKDKLFNNKVNNQQLKDLNIEYRKRWGVASHVDFTWWETYGDKVFELGKKQALEDELKFLEDLFKPDDKGTPLQFFKDGVWQTKFNMTKRITELKKRLEKLK